jgi:predicted metal-dependent phosphoesterase TrpH
LASLAHPVRLPQRDALSLGALLERLKSYGLRGIEVHHSEHRPEDSALFQSLAARFHLIETGGSDFHGDAKPDVRLGSGINGNVCLPYSFLEQIREAYFALN